MNIARTAFLGTSLTFAVAAIAAACGPGADTSSSGGGTGGSTGSSTSTSSAGSGGVTTDAPEPDPSDALFNPEHVVEVVIDMAPADWDALRYQGRNVQELLGEGCHDAPHPSPYTYFPATVTVDGQKLESSGVRKKGFLGSASLSKPSIKVSFDEYVAGRELFGVEGLTLNNSKQDRSLVKTCLALKVFRDAGVPASRCNHAHVTVNGADMGVYVHVEPVNKRFLGRHFADETGNLYEGQLSDFRTGWTASYEKKTNEADPDRSDLDAVTDALAAGDAELGAALGGVLDIDAFNRFWATETLVAAWDGYASNTNNHFVYHDPSSGKMAFVPWGPDMSFDEDDPFLPASRPQSVSAKGAVARRLYKVPAFKDQYVARMKELLDGPWKEDVLLAEIDRIQNMLAPYLGGSAASANAAADEVRFFVSDRRAALNAELSAPPAWGFPPPNGCLTTLGKLSGTFTTTFGSFAALQADPFNTGDATFDLEAPVGAPAITATATGAAAGFEAGPKGRREVLVVGAFPDGKTRAVVFYVDPEVFTAGKDGVYDWQSVFALMLDVQGPGQIATSGMAGEGTFHLDQAATTAGGPVSGSFEVTMLSSLFQ